MLSEYTTIWLVSPGEPQEISVSFSISFIFTGVEKPPAEVEGSHSKKFWFDPSGTSELTTSRLEISFSSLAFFYLIKNTFDDLGLEFPDVQTRYAVVFLWLSACRCIPNLENMLKNRE